MFFTLQELVRWLRMTAFELWLHLVSVLLFSIMAVLKYEEVWQVSWWAVFIPLFACDGLNAYFCVIVFIRQYMELDIKMASVRSLASALTIVLIFLFKLLLCQRLSGERDTSMSEVMGPLFVLLQIVMGVSSYLAAPYVLHPHLPGMIRKKLAKTRPCVQTSPE